MSSSFHVFNQKIRDYIIERFSPRTSILDVGPGRGKFAHILNEYHKMDCLEIFEPFVEKYHLQQLYRQVIVEDIRNFRFPAETYDLVIMGDVLEHLNASEAQKVTKYLHSQGSCILTSVPYELIQGELEDNIHEVHLQPDLTPEIMKKRYPDLTMIFSCETCGIYVSKNSIMSKVLSRIRAKDKKYTDKRNKAERYIMKGREGQALEFFLEMLTVDPCDPFLCCDIGKLQEKIGDLKEASKYYTKALGLYPGSEDIVLNVVKFLKKNQLNKDASSLCRSFLEVFPDAKKVKIELDSF